MRFISFFILSFEPKQDRPLQVVPKKGRPVSQCQHCRTMRKTRSAHIKCGCGRLTPAHMKPKESTEGDKGELAIHASPCLSSNSGLLHRELLLPLRRTLHLRPQETRTATRQGPWTRLSDGTCQGRSSKSLIPPDVGRGLLQSSAHTWHCHDAERDFQLQLRSLSSQYEQPGQRISPQ